MPLKKIWNALCGRSRRSARVSFDADLQSSAEAPDRIASANRTGKVESNHLPSIHSPRDAQRDGSGDATVEGKSNSAATSGSINRGKRRKWFRGGPNASLCKQLKAIKATRVLEIGVDDGQRAIDVVATLRKQTTDQQSDPVQYLVIDPFESAGHTDLKAFHQTLRGEQIRPRIFPDQCLATGITRVAHTVGVVDVVILGAPANRWQIPEVQNALLRVCHRDTVVFWYDGDQWKRLENFQMGTDAAEKARKAA